MKREKSCGTIIVEGGKVLLIGTKGDEGQLCWSFPKGHQEQGETDAETAIRETFEEVGLKTKIIDRNPIITSHLVRDGAAMKDVYLFFAKVMGGDLKPQEGEVEATKWVDFAEADELIFDYYKTAWEEAKKRLNEAADYDDEER